MKSSTISSSVGSDLRNHMLKCLKILFSLDRVFVRLRSNQLRCSIWGLKRYSETLSWGCADIFWPRDQCRSFSSSMLLLFHCQHRLDKESNTSLMSLTIPMKAATMTMVCLTATVSMLWRLGSDVDIWFVFVGTWKSGDHSPAVEVRDQAQDSQQEKKVQSFYSKEEKMIFIALCFDFTFFFSIL